MTLTSMNKIKYKDETGLVYHFPRSQSWKSDKAVFKGLNAAISPNFKASLLVNVQTLSPSFPEFSTIS